MENNLKYFWGNSVVVCVICLMLSACSGTANPADSGDENNPSDTTETEGRVPELQTLGVTSITKSSAKASGKVTDEGGLQISERGVAWDTTTTPSISGSHKGATSFQASGEFGVELSGLSPDTKYYVRAYAKNDAGVGYSDEISFKTEIDPYAGFKDQIVDVNVNARRQKFMGAGAAGASGGSWKNLSASKRDKAARMLAQDINLKFIKTYIGDVPSKAPSKYDNAIPVYNDIKTYNSDLKFQVTVNNLPDQLESKKGLYDEQITGVLDSVATYYFKVLDGFKQRGMPVDQLDLVNEPDHGRNDKKIHIGQLFAQTVSKLRAMINDPSINTHGVTMPDIVGPSCLSVRRSKEWLTKWKNELPAAFENIDIVSTHGYALGFSESAYREVHDLTEGKPFMNNEQTGKIGKRSPLAEYYSAGSEPNYVGDTSIALLLTDALNGGVNHFFAFRLYNTRGNNAALIQTKNNQVSKSKIYDGFKQVTSLQPDGSSVLENTLIQTGDSRIVSFRKDNESKVYLHYTNISPEEQNFSIALSDDGERVKISSVKAWVNDEQRESQLALDEAYGSDGVTHYDFKATPFSVNSFEIKMLN